MPHERWSHQYPCHGKSIFQDLHVLVTRSSDWLEALKRGVECWWSVDCGEERRAILRKRICIDENKKFNLILYNVHMYVCMYDNLLLLGSLLRCFLCCFLSFCSFLLVFLFCKFSLFLSLLGNVCLTFSNST